MRSYRTLLCDAARSQLFVFLVGAAHDDLQDIPGRGRCCLFASSHGARIQTSQIDFKAIHANTKLLPASACHPLIAASVGVR